MTLSPVFARFIIGLFGIVAATFMVAVNLAGWQGGADHLLVLFPFARTTGGIAQFLAGMWAYCALTVGGLAQFLAGMWAYHVRDALAIAMHGLWGSFWIAYGLYTLLVALGVLPPILARDSTASAYGFWFVVLGAITWIGAPAATTENVALAAALTMLTAGCALLAIGLLGVHAAVLGVGAYQLITGGLLPWYLAGATVLQATFGRHVLPIGERPRHPHLVTVRPSRSNTPPVNPGSRSDSDRTESRHHATGVRQRDQKSGSSIVGMAGDVTTAPIARSPAAR
ncbi:acetate uptake transporter family protein [Pseudonocardia alaniniphila]|uniref:GPR1/FUN34/YaaH family transporter n=1 Tax=Pseudonocardia alaniniphila TaxID=75291 RepID=A0ABS9TUP2_9PSEU|nr:GPR1/FUN34/YaaH family transporter [Pseudonocardia alaniniphila]MCH6172211.1 GPR1/FUN34/YaaH family transporter [Pseudonocardia alaniniphila]